MKLKIRKRLECRFDVPEAAENLGLRLARFFVVVLAVLIFLVYAF